VIANRTPQRTSAMNKSIEDAETPAEAMKMVGRVQDQSLDGFVCFLSFVEYFSICIIFLFFMYTLSCRADEQTNNKNTAGCFGDER
jgi:hypothetical protein